MQNTNRKTHDYSLDKIIACATVIEAMMPLIPPEMSYQTLDFGLHINPDELKASLQDAVNSTPPEIKHIILGYGLCSRAIIGLVSHHSTLVIPRVDDCIAIFLGSKDAYRHQHKNEPGTYYLTKGWLKTASTPFDEYESLVKRYGHDAANRILCQILKNYTRLAFIETGNNGLEQYRAQARDIAGRFGLKYENIPGSAALIRKMIFGPWDDDFLIVKPGEVVSFNNFMQTAVPS